MSKITLISLKWLDTNEGKKLISAKPVEVADTGAKRLLHNQDLTYPTWINQKDANKFDLDVSVEEVKEEKSTASKPEKPGPRNKPRVVSKEAVEAEKVNTEAGSHEETASAEE